MAEEEGPKPEEGVPLVEQRPSGELDPNVVGGVGLAMGGIIGLGLGLKAEHDAEVQGKPVSWVTKAAIIRGVIGLVVMVVALVVVLTVIASHHTPQLGPGFINTCQSIPKPGPSWHCVNGYWMSNVP